MSTPRVYSRYGIAAANFLGKQIRINRKLHGWTESELAERAGISRSTVKRIEKGDMSCALGLFFEVAVIVGVSLFQGDTVSLSGKIKQADGMIALLPKTIHESNKKVDDDF